MQPDSSKLQALAIDAVNNLVKGVSMKFEPSHLITLVLGLALTYAGTVVVRKWLENRATALELDARVKTSEEETKRIELLTQIQKEHPQLVVISEGADESRRKLMTSVRSEDSLEIGGVHLEGATVKKIARKPRKQIIKPIRIDGVFRILNVDASKRDGFKLKIHDASQDREIQAFLPDDTLDQQMREILQSAEWDKKEVVLEINAKQSGERITSAEIVSCKPRTQNQVQS